MENIIHAIYFTRTNPTNSKQQMSELTIGNRDTGGNATWNFVQ